MALSTPRILPSHLHHFSPDKHPQTSTVRLLGTITSIHGDTATLTSGTQNETVTLVLNRDSHVSQQHVYEVVGKVINLEGGQGLGIRVLSATEWPKSENGNIDFKAFEAVVDATHTYKEIFYGEPVENGNNGGGGGY